MDPYCPGSLLSWIHIVLDPLCPGSILSQIHLVLDPSCPGSILSWISFVPDPFCPVLLGQRGQPWQGNIGQGHGRWNGIGKEPHFQPMGQKMKKIGPKIAKKSKIEDFGSRLVQIDFRLGRSPWNFILHRQERINILKYSIFDWFWKDKYTFKNC